MSIDNLENTLRMEVDGDIHFDDIHRKVYSVDASIYEVEPIGIVLPKTKEALIKTVKIANTYRVPVIARGAATGITGGCLGTALIIDTSKYLNQILEINIPQEYIVCEPGVVQDKLNEALASYGYRLGPDTSTGNRATIGGMLANNSAGSRSLIYGTMANHIQGVELLLVNGELLYFSELDRQSLEAKEALKDTEGHIYREFARIRKEYAEDIQHRFPNIPRRVSGYNLNALIQPHHFNPCHLIAGSEGTLGISTEIRLKIVKKPSHLGMCIIYHQDMFQGMHSIEKMLEHHPSAIEMLDSHIIEQGKITPSMRGKCEWLKDTPQALFIIEFFGQTDEEVFQKLQSFSDEMKKNSIGYDLITTQDLTQMANVWELRKSGLGLLLSKRSYSRAIAFLEDISIPPAKLGDFMIKFHDYLKSKNKEAGIYGHVGSGCMHIRPYINLKQIDDVKIMEQIMLDTSDLLLEYGGALSGEHGDGRIRTWLNRKMFGERLYSAFVELKAAFDPENRMNPGKIVHGTPLLDHLRMDPSVKQIKIDTFLDFSKEGGFELAVDMCNGNGACRKAEKIMCPSFQATGDEFHSTRARAQALRGIVNGKTPDSSLASQELFDVLDLCLECKGCKTECPSEVDMAKMKAEVLHHYHKKHGISLRSRLFANLGQLSWLGSSFAPMINMMNNSSWIKKLSQKLGITSERPLPQLSKEQFSIWFDKRKNRLISNKKVILFNDTYTEFFHPEIGQAAIKVLETLGYQVIVPPWKCCGRPAISKGLLSKAKSMADNLVSLLATYSEQQIPIIGLEPSCILTLKDDFFGLLGSEHKVLNQIASQCITFDEFLAKHIEEKDFAKHFKMDKKKFLLHGHCHQKALVGTKSSMQLLKAMPSWEASEIDSGCCGMAGSFGYEQEHYDLSMKIGELKLFPAVKNAANDITLIANGFSCRGQIMHGTNKRALHIAEALAKELI